MHYSILDFIGNLGVAFILLGYLMLQIEKIKSNSLLYSFLNFIGASLIIISLLENFNLSAFIIEIFWLGISLIGIIRYFWNSKLTKSRN